MTSADPPSLERPVLVVEQGGRGGVADYSSEIAAALAAEGVSIVLATARDHLYEPAEGVEVWTPFYYLRGGSRLRDLLRRLRLHKMVNGLAFLAAVPRVTTRARRCDIVHLQGGELPPLYLVLVLALRVTRATIVHTMHNTFDRGRSWRRVRDLIALSASRVIVHAQSDLANVSTAVRPRTRVIPLGEYRGFARRGGGGVDRTAARATLGLPSDAFVALVFGQLRLDKGIDDVLVAARDVPGLHVVVAGEDRGALAATAGSRAALELAGRVHVFEGFHSNEAAAEFFSAADVVLLPYKRASQSGVLLLSWAFARPVIAYPVGGLVEAIEPGRTGWLTAEPTPAALAETLTAVVAAGRDESARRGDEGAQIAAERYSWSAIARRTIGVYREALA